MSKKGLNTYQLPHQVQREYHQLMNSKENFKKNLSPAEQHKLETLYAQLKDVWNQNLIESLKTSLEKKYQELREIQTLIEQDWTKYEKIVEQELKVTIQQYSRQLEKGETNLKEKQKLLNKNIETWKADIIKSQEKLQLRTKNLNLEFNQKLKKVQEQEKQLNIEEEKLKEIKNLNSETLNLEEKQIQELKNLLIETSKRKDLESTKSLAQEAPFQQSLISLRTQLETNLKSLRIENEKKAAGLAKKRKANQLSFEKQKKELEENLKNYESELLIQLREELATELTNCPEELIQLFKLGDDFEISKRLTLLTNDTEQLGKALTRELTKIGLTKEKFLERLEKNQNHPHA